MHLRLLALCFLAMVGAAAAHADERVFNREDYESYFAPGRFATWSPFYESNGVMDVVSRRSSQAAGQYFLEQTTKSFDVSANYDTLSDYDYYKIESVHTDQMVWNSRRNVYAYDYSEKEFHTETSRVWESHDERVDVSAGDKSRGELQKFYRDADKRAGHDPQDQEAEFLKQVIGAWTWRCAYVVRDKFDVECRATHQTSGRVETFFFRKLDLVG